MSLKTFLFGEPARSISAEPPDLTEEVEGLLLALGRSLEGPHKAIIGTLRTLKFFAEENREAALVATAKLVLCNSHVVKDFLGYNMVAPGAGRGSEWPHLIAKGTAIACVFLDATELVKILSRALTIHPEETEELSLALDWVLMPSEKRREILNPFKCLIA